MANEETRHRFHLEHLSLLSETARNDEVFEANVLDQLLLPEVWRDPYPFYSTLRARGIVRHVGSMPGLVFTRHADVSALLRDSRFSNHFPLKYSRARTSPPDEERIHARVLEFFSRGWMQSSDERLHSTVRRHLNPLFSQTQVSRFAHRISSICSRLLMAASPPSMDFICDFAQPLLNDVLSDVFGVPPEACEHVNRCSSAIATFLGTTDPDREELEAVDREMNGLTEILVPIIEARRRSPLDDVITALSDSSDLALPTEDVAVQCSLTLAAGLETTAGLLGNSLLAFLRHPASIDRVRHNTILLGAAVEECLRYDSPSQWVPRVALEDLQLNGISVRAQELVWLGLGSANRDPAQFPSADLFDISRKPKALVSFGGGVHHCLGAHLARLEANIALETVFHQLERLELDIEDVPYRSNFGIRSPQSLPIRFRHCKR